MNSQRPADLYIQQYQVPPWAVAQKVLQRLLLQVAAPKLSQLMQITAQFNGGLGMERQAVITLGLRPRPAPTSNSQAWLSAVPPSASLSRRQASDMVAEVVMA